MDDWNYRRRAGEGTVEDRAIKLVNEYNDYIYILKSVLVVTQILSYSR